MCICLILGLDKGAKYSKLSTTNKMPINGLISLEPALYALCYQTFLNNHNNLNQLLQF